MSEEWASPVEGGGEFIRISALAGHLIIAYPIGYIEHMPTRFSTPDKRSDAIACDIVDLDAVDDYGQPGKIYRNQRFMQGQVIASLRPRIGGRVLGRVTQGVSRNGMNPPWQIQDATRDPEAVARASAWVQSHGDFVSSEFIPFVPRQPVAQPQFQQPPAQQQYGQPPQYNYGQPQPQPQWPAPQPQFQQTPPPGYGQPGGYDVGPSPQGPPPEWALPPVPQQPAFQQAQAPVQMMPPPPSVPMVPAVGSPATLSEPQLNMLERLRQQTGWRPSGTYDEEGERQRFGF